MYLKKQNIDQYEILQKWSVIQGESSISVHGRHHF
jgi:hypothetical protein